MIRIVMVAALLASSCGGDAEEALLERTASATRPSMASSMTTTMEVRTAELPRLNQAEQAARALDETVTSAIAAAEAAEVGASHCDAAYESASELVRVVRERFPEDARDLPPRELFVAECQRMPEAVQRCLLVRYAIEHREECEAAQEALPAADRERMENLLAGR